VKIYNLVQREMAYTTQIDHSGKYIPYFEQDNFPVELSSLVQGSPTATSCLSTLTDFITGEGFNEGADLENLVINKQGLKLFQFHSICSSSIAHKWGVACLVRYNKAGGITEIIDIPFGYCRLGIPDDNGVISEIKYNPYFGTTLYRNKDTVVYDAFNPTEAVVQRGKDPDKWKGQIFWVGIRDEKHPFYPVPDYYSAKHWMNVEKNAGIYFDDQLENGFLQDTMIKLIGDPNDASGVKKNDTEEYTKGELFSKEMTNNFSGAKNRHKILAMWGNNKEEHPSLEAFPSSGNPDLFRIQDEHAIKKITIATKVPGVLANIQDTNNFSGEQIRPAVKLMQQRAVRYQDILIDFYSQMLKLYINPVTDQITIVDYNPYPEAQTVDAQTWGVLTDQEKRKWVKDNTEIEIVDEVPPPTQPNTPENRIVALHFNSYPKKARENVKRALEWQEKNDKKYSKGFGLELSNQILSGTPLGPREIRRISNYLSKNVLFKDKMYSDGADAVLFDAWGGVDMMIWANEKVKELKGETD
jgi:hypothetical protein